MKYEAHITFFEPETIPAREHFERVILDTNPALDAGWAQL